MGTKLLCLFFCTGISYFSISQPPTPVDSVASLTPVRFGNKIPQGLMKYSKTSGIHYGQAQDFSWAFDSLPINYQKKYEDWFSVFSFPFAGLTITVNGRRQVMSLSLVSFFNDTTDSSLINQPSILYNRLFTRLEALYGTSNSTEKSESMDTAMLKESGSGIPFLAIWSGNNVIVTLRAYSGSRFGANVCTVEIRNNKFQEAPQLMERSN